MGAQSATRLSVRQGLVLPAPQTLRGLPCSATMNLPLQTQVGDRPPLCRERAGVLQQLYHSLACRPCSLQKVSSRTFWGDQRVAQGVGLMPLPLDPAKHPSQKNPKRQDPESATPEPSNALESFMGPNPQPKFQSPRRPAPKP